jgi:MoxR-like ATPase
MTRLPDSDLLDRLDGGDFGSGGTPAAGAAADDRSGRFWLVVDDRIRLAVKVALLTGRPLLVEGEPGSGKSSLARALANTLGWSYLEHVMTSQTRLDELTGYVDHVARLHEAQLSGRVEGRTFPAELQPFVRPGVLWWALDPASAASCGSEEGAEGAEGQRDPRELPVGGLAERSSAVVLLDEIDKAEPDLPNNLLVPLGSLELRVEGRPDKVTPACDYPPLVVITSNRERDLPPAFLRRCILIALAFPSPAQLVQIAAGHVPEAGAALIAAVRDRFVPGDQNDEMSPAEFVDAVRAAHGLGLQAGDERWDDVEAIMRRRDESD